MDDLEKLNITAKKMIRQFVLDTFGSEVLNKVNEVIDEITVSMDSAEENKNFAGYYIDKKIFITEEQFLENKNKIVNLSTIIHEYAHAFSDLISTKEINHAIEEGYADLFADMCINYNLRNNKEIPYIHKEEYEDKKEKGVESISYYREGSFIRALQYALIQSGHDDEAIEKYFFESKNEFMFFCTDILGEKFEDIGRKILELRDNENYLNNNEIEKALASIENDMANLIRQYYEETLDENCLYGDTKLDDQKYYTTRSCILEKAYCDKIIREICPDMNNIKDDDIKKILDEIGPSIQYVYSEYGYTDTTVDLIDGWYNHCKRDYEKFCEVADLLYGIPFNLVPTIIEDMYETDLLDIDDLAQIYQELKIEKTEDSLDYILNYYEEIDEEYMRYIFEISKSINNEDTPSINEFIFRFIKKLDLTVDEQKEVFKFFYSSDRDDCLNNILAIFEDKGILDMDLFEQNYTEEERLGAGLFSILMCDEMFLEEDFYHINNIKEDIEEDEGKYTIRNIIIKNFDNDVIVVYDNEEIEDNILDSMKKIKRNVKKIDKQKAESSYER